MASQLEPATREYSAHRRHRRKTGKQIVQRALPGLRVRSGLGPGDRQRRECRRTARAHAQDLRRADAPPASTASRWATTSIAAAKSTPMLDGDAPIVKPANFPRSAPGRDWAVVRAANGVDVAVFSLLGRVFMRPVDCPWTRADRVLAEIPPRSHGPRARLPRRSHQRQAADGPLSRRPRDRGARARTRTCRPPTNRSFPAAPRFNAMSA